MPQRSFLVMFRRGNAHRFDSAIPEPRSQSFFTLRSAALQEPEGQSPSPNRRRFDGAINAKNRLHPSSRSYWGLPSPWITPRRPLAILAQNADNGGYCRDSVCPDDKGCRKGMLFGAFTSALPGASVSG